MKFHADAALMRRISNRSAFLPTPCP